MKIIIAPDSFKECLPSPEVACQIAAGFRQVLPGAELVEIPIADGGEGTVDALIAATGGRLVEVDVTGPLNQQVSAFYGITGDGRTAVIEMAAASGLTLVPSLQRNPLYTTSYGTGELIRHALGQNIRHFIIGIGGSATNDAGAGMLQALGVRLLDRQGESIGFGGGELAHLEEIDISQLDPRLAESEMLIACDVDNPLIGAHGATRIFAPQKGGDEKMIEILEANLTHFVSKVTQQLGRDIATLPGGGAAGGIGAAFHAFLGGQLRSGVDIVLQAVELEKHLSGSDLVITGEGRMDGQSLHGKAPVGVARAAAKFGVPVIAVAGSIEAGGEKVNESAITALFSISPGPGSLAEALSQARRDLFFWARNMASVVKAFSRDKEDLRKGKSVV